MARRVWIVVVAGVAIGAWGRVCDHLHAPAWHWLSALGSPWLATAFGVGALAGVPRRRDGAVVAALALSLGVVTYYALFRFVELRTSTWYAGVMGVGWSLAALPIGAAFGWLGATWRARRGPLATGALAGALLGEALLLRVLWHAPAAVRVLHVEALVGVVAALTLSRARLRAVAATAGVALVVVAAEEAVRTTLRATGWAGA